MGAIADPTFAYATVRHDSVAFLMLYSSPIGHLLLAEFIACITPLLSSRSSSPSLPAAALPTRY